MVQSLIPPSEFLYTIESIQGEIENYALANSDTIPEEMLLEEFKSLQRESSAAHAISGISDKKNLIPEIPLHRVLPPVLHIQLGLTNYLDRRLVGFIRTSIEPDLPDVLQKKVEIAAAENSLAHYEREFQR